jgi:hypothetical protein
MRKELKEPKASPAKVAYHLQQLRKLFIRMSDQNFLQMVWAIDALGSGRPEAAARLKPKKGALIDAPDLLVRDGERTVIAVECKATKLTYLAQFAEDPFEAEKKQYLQIANGVFQLWRFFSHVRRGLVKEAVDSVTSAIVLTLDSFFTMDRDLKAKIIEEATSLADKEGDIAAEDRRHIISEPFHRR